MQRDCKNCKQTCCDNIVLSLVKKDVGIEPTTVKTGDWIYAVGIYWVKKKNGKWKCRAFNAKLRLCKNYKYRPLLCRMYVCKYGKKRRTKLPVNNPGYAKSDSIYLVTFMLNEINKRIK